MKDFEKLKKMLKDVSKEKTQRAAVLAAITSAYEKNASDADFKENLAVRLIAVMSECQVNDYIDGRTTVAIMEACPKLKSQLDDRMLKQYDIMRGLVEEMSADIATEIAKEGSFDPTIVGEA